MNRRDLTGHLTDDEETFAMNVAQERTGYARSSGLRNRFPGGGGRWDVVGARGEVFVRRLFGIPLDFVEMTEYDHAQRLDVPGVGDVRSTSRDYGGLPIHMEDDDDRIALLVTGREALTLRGWIYNGWGKRRPYWREDLGEPFFWLVPQRDLRDPLDHPASLTPRLGLF